MGIYWRSLSVVWVTLMRFALVAANTDISQTFLDAVDHLDVAQVKAMVENESIRSHLVQSGTLLESLETALQDKQKLPVAHVLVNYPSVYRVMDPKQFGNYFVSAARDNDVGLVKVFLSKLELYRFIPGSSLLLAIGGANADGNENDALSLLLKDSSFMRYVHPDSHTMGGLYRKLVLRNDLYHLKLFVTQPKCIRPVTDEILGSALVDGAQRGHTRPARYILSRFPLRFRIRMTAYKDLLKESLIHSDANLFKAIVEESQRTKKVPPQFRRKAYILSTIRNLQPLLDGEHEAGLRSMLQSLSYTEHLDVIQVILKQPSLVKRLYQKGIWSEVFIKASERDEMTVVKTLLESKTCSFFEWIDVFHAFDSAAEAGHVQLAKYIFNFDHWRRGVKEDFENNLKVILDKSLEWNELDLTQAIVEQEGLLKLLVRKGIANELMVSAAKRKGNDVPPATQDNHLPKDAKSDAILQAFLESAQAKKTEAAYYYLARFKIPKPVREDFETNLIYLFRNRAEAGEIEIFFTLLEQPSLVHELIKNGAWGEALKSAASEGQLEIVRLMVESKFWSSISTNDLGQAFQRTAVREHTSTVDYLISQKHFMEQVPEVYFVEAFKSAVFHGRYDIIRLFLKNDYCRSRIVYLHGLMNKATLDGHRDIIEIISQDSDLLLNLSELDFSATLRALMLDENRDQLRLVLHSSAKGIKAHTIKEMLVFALDKNQKGSLGVLLSHVSLLQELRGKDVSDLARHFAESGRVDALQVFLSNPTLSSKVSRQAIHDIVTKALGSVSEKNSDQDAQRKVLRAMGTSSDVRASLQHSLLSKISEVLGDSAFLLSVPKKMVCIYY